MSLKKVAKTIMSIFLTSSMTIAFVGCSSEEPTPIDVNGDTEIEETTDTTQGQNEVADSNAVETAVTISTESDGTTEGSSDTSSETSSANTTSSNGTNLPTVTSTQTTTKPATTTTQSSNIPAITNRPAYTAPTTASHTHSYVMIGMDYSSTSSNTKTTITTITTYACICGDWYQVTDTETYGNDEVPVTTTPVMTATSIVTTQPTATNPAPAVTTASTTKDTATSKPAVTTTTTKAAPSVTTTPVPAVTTKPAPAVTTTPAATTTPKPAVTTTTAATTAPAVTTTTTPAVTTQPAPSHVHSYTGKVTKETTCTEDGIMTYTCSCGDSYTESIRTWGHHWSKETIHHDAVYGTRDVTDTWVHGYYIMGLALTSKGVEAGLGGNNLTDPLFIKLGLNKYATDRYYVLLTEFWGKPGDPSSVEWVYTYNDIDPKELEEAAKLIGRDDIKYDIGVLEDAVGHDHIDWLKNGLWWGNWGTNDHYEYEDRVVGTETYVITPAYDETVTICVDCGKIK